MFLSFPPPVCVCMCVCVLKMRLYSWGRIKFCIEMGWKVLEYRAFLTVHLGRLTSFLPFPIVSPLKSCWQNEEESAVTSECTPSTGGHFILFRLLDCFAEGHQRPHPSHRDRQGNKSFFLSPKGWQAFSDVYLHWRVTTLEGKVERDRHN